MLKSVNWWLLYAGIAREDFYLNHAADMADLHYLPLYAGKFSLKDDKLYYEGRAVNDEDLPRNVLRRGNFGNRIHDYFERKGVRVVNNSVAQKNCDDKLIGHKIVDYLGLPQPKYRHFRNQASYERISGELGVPFVAKNRFGMCGKEVYFIDNEQGLEKIYDEHPEKEILFQEFVGDPNKKQAQDIRMMVVGGKVIGAITRTNRNGRRANVSQGAVAKPVSVSGRLCKRALDIAAVHKGEVLSVDFFTDGRFCEANATPDTKPFADMGIDKAIVDYITRT